MCRNRFNKIRQYVHVNDRENMPPRRPQQDKLYKVRPLIEAVSRTLIEQYNPTQNASIDEGMVKYKGRLAFKQYMPFKPIKQGIKVWIRSDFKSTQANKMASRQTWMTLFIN